MIMKNGIDKIDFKRQKRIFNPDNQITHIVVVGAGSIGSFITLTLVKLGFKYIHVFDEDKVEAHNIPNQFYRYKDIGNSKVSSLKNIVKQFTNVEIKCHNNFLKDVIKQIEIEQNMVVIYALDSLQERKKLTKQFKDWPIKLIDIRVGGEGWSIHNVDFTNTDEYDNYVKTLDIKVRRMPCGAQSVIYNILNVSSEVGRIVKLINNKEKTSSIVKREMNNYMFING